MATTENVFLTAEWRDLVMLNYEVDPAYLQRLVPAGTELDSFSGKTYASLVGFRFRDTRLRGRFSIPFHSDFEEVNLRFYVRRKTNGESRRGVVFIAEIVGKLAIAKTARWVYGENYVHLRMRHQVNALGSGRSAEYSWHGAAGTCALRAESPGTASLPAEGSLEQFITEHYWGYSRLRDGSSLEYQVIHPPWRVWNASRAEFTGNPSELYGRDLERVLSHPPDSAFIAEGSRVSVMNGKPIRGDKT
jgi:uncharacterized protein YqjF (DUF2071 family)